jgi:hypothetical protein
MSEKKVVSRNAAIAPGRWARLCVALYNFCLKPLNGLALLFDRSPILTLAILPFIGLPVIYILIFVALPGFIKAAMTVLAFVAFALVRDRD